MKRHKKKEPPVGRVKFYADENIPKQLIEYLRTDHNINITSAQEMGFQGRDDKFQFQEAKRQGRFLLTCDTGFLDHGRFRFNQMQGVVILDIPKEPPGLGWMSLWLESEIVPSGSGIKGTKIVVHHDRFDLYSMDDRGIVNKQVLNPFKPEKEKQ